MHSGMYKDCVDEQKHLEREDSDVEEEKQTRKRKRKQIKVYECKIFDRTYIIFISSYSLMMMLRKRN